MPNSYNPLTDTNQEAASQVLTDVPNSLVEALQKTNDAPKDGFNKNVGAVIAFPGGRDYSTVRCRVVSSTYKNAADDEKALYLSQGNGLSGSISISLSTLEAIIAWAKEGSLNGDLANKQ
jgi:hypothetical protein